MKRFSFSLERLRRWRRRQLELEQEKLRGMIAQLEQMEAARLRVIEEETRAVSQVIAKREVATDDLLWVESWRNFALRETARLTAAIEEQARRVAVQRQAVLEANRRIEILQRLREEQLSAWRAGHDREQESAVGELVASRWRLPE